MSEHQITIKEIIESLQDLFTEGFELLKDLRDKVELEENSDNYKKEKQKKLFKDKYQKADVK